RAAIEAAGDCAKGCFKSCPKGYFKSYPNGQHHNKTARQANRSSRRRHAFHRCSRRGGGGRAAATFGAERAAGKGSPNGRTSRAKRCSARRRRTGHEEQSTAPATSTASIEQKRERKLGS